MTEVIFYVLKTVLQGRESGLWAAFIRGEFTPGLYFHKIFFKQFARVV